MLQPSFNTRTQTLLNLRRGFYAALPQRMLSGFGARAARIRGGPFTTAFIRWFIRHYGVNMAEAANPNPRSYRSFSAFFTRALVNGARTMPDNPAAVASPVDGVVSACAAISDDAIFQAKGLSYSSAVLLGDTETATRYENGNFITLYLRPCDYHRVHAPLAGDLVRVRHIAGRLWPVRPWAVQALPDLFTRNERLVLEFATERGPFALVMVGALMVGGLETVATGAIGGGRHAPARWNLEAAPRRFARGEEVGRFNFGSTVILLFPENTVTLADSLVPGKELRLGQTIGDSKEV
jgi:phosphatidylserine decarboxylase